MSRSVLVVDDEPDMIALFRRRFRREIRAGEYAFEFASSGEEALGSLERHPAPEIVLILSDINMPGMSGLELLRQVKERRPELPVAMITAYADDERRETAMRLGAADFLAKPIDFDVLKASLPRMMEGPSA